MDIIHFLWEKYIKNLMLIDWIQYSTALTLKNIIEMQIYFFAIGSNSLLNEIHVKHL